MSVTTKKITRYVISGGCMQPLITNGDLVVVKAQRFYWPGDVVVFQAANDQLFAHRAIGLYRKGDDWKFVTASDRGGVDTAVSSSQIIGKVINGFCGSKAFNIPLTTRFSTLLRFLGYSIRQLFKKIYVYAIN